MKLIVGLGNPGEKYEKTKHNIGFEVIDKILSNSHLKLENKPDFKSQMFKGDDFILLKPMTYMNLSGEAVKKVMDFYKISMSDLVVVCDELDIKIGQAKIKKSNSSGGHNGVKNIIEKLNSSDFWRLRIGIGRPSKESQIPISTYVLEPFNDKNRIIIDKVIEKAANAIMNIIYNSVPYVINYFNKKD